ncbi:MAG: hypothetical protein PWQ32_135 [Thermococcaceae archaeon]|nr:hypothetical protein [Thermococcaceae archaeon]
MYKQLFTLLILVFSIFVAPASASPDICGPDFNVTWAYCDFFPLIKTGEDDAIITLVWDRMDERIVGNETDYYVGYVGDYYFYFKDGKIYYLGNTTGGDQLRYVFYNGKWYLGWCLTNRSYREVIDPRVPCIERAVEFPPRVVDAMKSKNYSLSSKYYPAYINGSKIYTSNGSVSYVIDIPSNMSMNLPDNVALGAVFLRRGVLLFLYPENGLVYFDWGNLTVLYYDGSSLRRLNFTEGMKNTLPLCQKEPQTVNTTPQGESLKFYGILLAVAILVLLLGWKEKRR